MYKIVLISPLSIWWVATIAVIVAIAEINKVQRSYRNHSPAIAGTTIASDCCRCDRLRVVSYDRYWSLGSLFFSAIAAITAIVVIIWKAGFNFIMAYFQFKSKDCLQRNLYLNCVPLWKALKARDIVWSVSISAVNHIIKEATCDPGIRISRFQGDWSFTRYMWGVQAVWESLNDFQTYLPISS